MGKFEFQNNIIEKSENTKKVERNLTQSINAPL